MLTLDVSGHDGGGLHQPHVYQPRLLSPLLCQERLVRPALQNFTVSLKAQ